MEAMNVEPWMIKDFSEIEREQIIKESKKLTFHKFSDFIEWLEGKAKMVNGIDIPMDDNNNDYNIT